MEETPDKPAGTEEHPPDRNPARQGPSREDGTDSPVEEDGQRTDASPPGEGSPGRPGVTTPKR